MILYNITINIEAAYHDEWLQWMKNNHIPTLMSTGLFVKNQILRLMTDEESGGYTYAFQYYLQTLADLAEYEHTYAGIFQAEHQKRYQEKFVSFQTILEVIE